MSLICMEIQKILKEFNLDYELKVVTTLKCCVENMIIRLLNEAECYKVGDQIDKDTISLAIYFSNEKQKTLMHDVSYELSSYFLLNAIMQQLSLHTPFLHLELKQLANIVNDKPIVKKESCGLKIPKDSLGGCNYQLMNPNKKVQVEAAENYRHFTFLVPQKQKPNAGPYLFKNKPALPEMPMKITIRPKFNVQSMFKKRSMK